MGAWCKKGIWQAKHNLKFFLTPPERIKLFFRYPELFLGDRQLLLIAAGAGFTLIVLVIAAAFVIIFKLKRRRAGGTVSTGQRR